MQSLSDLIQTVQLPLAIAAIIALFGLWLTWTMSYGLWRGSLAALCRVGWLAPLALGFFPESETLKLPRALTFKPVHVLLDDSASMRRKGPDGLAPLTTAETILQRVKDDCARLGCIPKVERLSEQAETEVRNGFTPLGAVLDSWLYKVGDDPWLLVTDGGDERPEESWAASLKGVGSPETPGKAPRGLVVGFAPHTLHNIFIKSYDVPPFAFESRPVVIAVTLGRDGVSPSPVRVQLQVLTEGTPLATVNAEFGAKDLESRVSVTMPPLPRGQHLVTVRALPTADETALWDNTVNAQTQVLPNTVGVLHLNGSPSWDGRFLRRYLKSEPKYDLISFFILRDPWDSQQVSERELSLIPFPVERLFNQELPNFRVVVIQNFTLFQFLLPEYQENLVKFVQQGGGLLFIGGPRALTAADLSSTPLKEILPFEVPADLAAGGGLEGLPFPDEADEGGGERSPADRAVPRHGPAYDPELAFTVEMARPPAAKRALANVYEDWEALADPLTRWRGAKGLHHMERVKLKDSTTVLLNARTDKTTMPLAVASYPGKGRALWIFSDALWKLALTPSSSTSRQVYNRFMSGAMTWLTRQDLRQPLVLKNLSLHGDQQTPPTFTVDVQGPAARYFQPSPAWQVTACGTAVPSERLTVTKHAADQWELQGPIPQNLAYGSRCTLAVEGTHPAFGSVKAAITQVFPKVYKDAELDAAPEKLGKLAKLTGAALTVAPSDPGAALGRWLAAATGFDGVALPDRFKTLRNFYWVLDKSWFWLLLLLLPLEVVVRRWDHIFTAARSEVDGKGVEERHGA